jgi:hypothetical protein
VDHVVEDRPRCPAGTSQDLVSDGDEGGISELCLTEAVEDAETQCEENQNGPVFRGVAMGQCVRHHIGRPELVSDSEIKAQELAHPMVMSDHRKPLVQQVLEAVVVRFGYEPMAP